MKNIIYTILAIFTLNMSVAQSPAPAVNQLKPILIINGTAHLGDGSIVENSAIGFANGKINFVGNANDANLNRSNYDIIDAKGKHIYPGFIIPNSDLGLNEVSAVRATQDGDETGALNPNVRSIIAYNTDSELIPTLRFNGVLTAQVVPKGGSISGTSSIVQLDAWNWEDAGLKVDDGLHLNWPNKKLRRRWWMGETEGQPNKNYDKSVKQLKKLFTDASSYSKSSKAPMNLRLESMKGLFDGSKQLFIHENKAVDILTSINYAKEIGVKKIVLVGGEDALYIKSFLLENNISIILSDVHRLPSRTEEDVDMPYKLPFLLNQAGIKYCLGYEGVANSRNLPFFAGTSAAYGLDKELALKSITLDAAEILGVADQLGSLTTGKNATLFISEGDALDMRTNKMVAVYIGGRKVTLEAMQQRLYKKYQAKYGQ